MNIQLDREKRKQEVKELTTALMNQSKSNQPVCKGCGNRFKPDKEQMKVEIPETSEVPPHANKTDFIENPDYCSESCKTADKL